VGGINHDPRAGYSSLLMLKLSLCLTKYHAAKTCPLLKDHAMKTYWILNLDTRWS